MSGEASESAAPKGEADGAWSLPTGRWIVDPSHSTIGFRVVDAIGTVAAIRGRFRDFEGAIDAEPDPAASRVGGVVQVASLSTDSEERDADLLSEEFFNAAAYPEIRFASREIRASGAAIGVDGALTLQGADRDVHLDLELRRIGEDHRARRRAAIEGSAEIGFADTTVEIVLELSLLHEPMT